MRNSLLIATAAATLAGCNLAPAYLAPDLPIAQRFPEAGTALATAPLGWDEYFVDDRLKAYLAAALANNRDLAQAYARIDQARAQYRVQTSQRLPGVDASGSGTRAQQPLSALALPGIEGGSFTTDQYSVAAATSFELDLWGRVRNLSEAQRSTYLASIEGARAFQLSLLSQVAGAYIDIQAGEEQIALAERTLALREEGLVIARRRLDAGVTSSIDYDQSALLVGQARTQLAELHRTTDQARNLMEVLIGGPMVGDLPAASSLEESHFNTVQPGLPAEVLLNRPDVLAAELELRAANANIGAARAAFLPTISLTGQFGYAAPALEDLFKSETESWSYGGSVNLPIFDWGRRKGQLDLSRAQAAELTAAYQLTVQKAFQEVADALVARRRYTEQIEALRETVEIQGRLAQTARRRYDAGVSTYLEVLDAERSLFSAQQELIGLRSMNLQNAVSLYIALGGAVRFPNAAF